MNKDEMIEQAAKEFLASELFRPDSDVWICWRDGWLAGAAAEREACAKLCESDDSMRWAGAAEAIRARGEK